MANILVRRDQFNITREGIVHEPTDAAFTPYRGDPYSGITRLGQLGNNNPNGNSFRPEDVQRVMCELWAEYVVDNPQLFKTRELKQITGFNWPEPQIQTDRGSISHRS